MDGSARKPSTSGSDGDSHGNDPSFPSNSGLAAMGIQFLIAVLLCLFGGKWLDERLGTTPVLLIVGVFTGAGVSTYAMYRRVFPREPRNQSKPPAAPRNAP